MTSFLECIVVQSQADHKRRTDFEKGFELDVAHFSDDPSFVNGRNLFCERQRFLCQTSTFYSNVRRDMCLCLSGRDRDNDCRGTVFITYIVLDDDSRTNTALFAAIAYTSQIRAVFVLLHPY